MEGANKYIRQLRWNGKLVLAQNEIKYYNCLVKFIDQHKLELTNPKKKTTETITAKYILVSTGGRPTYPEDCEGAREHAITSDDIFYLKENPGKTLIVGAGYIALETAGFLRGFGNDVSVMVRSVILREFDKDVANRVGAYMEKQGIKFIPKCIPVKIEKLENGKKKVTYKSLKDETLHTEEFDTVMFAIGRTANTANLNLPAAGVKVNPKNLKIITNEKDETSTPHIFALGDVSDGRPELTPPAVMAGKLLAERLFGKSTQLMDYRNIATTIFTPLEYGAVGYTEDKAIEAFGKDNIVGYHGSFKPLEWNFSETHPSDACYIKMVCKKEGNAEKVIGLHFLGPNAGEVIQGFAVAVRIGVTKEQIDNTVGIHPTCAEEIIGLSFKTDQPIDQSEGCKGCGF